jgi:two-component system sensor histidine kinase GlrK
VYYPRSFLKFILLSFLLVSLPLLYALAELLLSVDRLASQSREEVQNAALAARTSRVLFDQTTTLERVVRQQLILDDPRCSTTTRACASEFRQTGEQLAALPLEASERATLAKLLGREDALSAELARPRAPRGAVRSPKASPSSSTRRRRCSRHRRSSRSARSSGCRSRRRARGRPGCGSRSRPPRSRCALAIFFAVLIARPIRQLDLAIRQMGTADFTHAIVVNGPQDIRYLGQRLEWLRSRLHDLEEQQTRFLRHVSHELKTPLTAVREGAELLRDEVGGKLTREQHDIVRIVRENTLSLQKLIEDLLRWHQTRVVEPATVGPVELPDIVRRVVREQKLAALARMIAFDTQLEPAIVTGDAERIRTIVDNLVSNAIKYSPRSGTIDAKLRARDGLAVLEVADEGRESRRRRGPRVRVVLPGRAATRERVKGSGLGLAIAREYALAHGGRVEVVDRPTGARGACFRLVLSARDGTARRRVAAARPDGGVE